MALNYVVAYDITQNKRRRKISDFLQGWGNRAQESVFVCRVPNENMPGFVETLESLIDAETDCVAVFRQCASCGKATLLLGEAAAMTEDICVMSF